MLGEEPAIHVPCMDQAVEPLPQPKGDRPASGNAQEQAGIVADISR